MTIAPSPTNHEYGNILVVDDTEASRDYMAYTLTASGFSVRTAGDVRDSKKILAEFKPDLALLDVNLPDGNGYDLCRELRMRRDLADMAIVTTSAVSTRDIDRNAAIDSGADAFISLPADPGEILAVVRAVIGMRPQVAARRALHATPTSGGAVIVVADDARRDAVGALCAEAGIAATAARSVAEARSVLDDITPEVVLVDAALPDDDRAAFCRTLRRYEELDAVAIVGLSWQGEAIVDCPLADGHIVLPCCPAEFGAAVQSVARVRRAEATERSAARMWDAYFRVTSAGMALLSFNGTVLHVNQALADLEQRSVAELAGCHLLEYLPPDTHDLVTAQFEALLESDDPRSQIETDLVRADGVRVPVAVRGTRLSDPSADGGGVVVVKVEDLTARNRMLDDLVRAGDAKSELLSRTSHEMRTPLNAISGFAQLLGDEPLDPDAAAMVDQIRRSASDLTRIVDALLDIARADSEGATAAMSPVPLRPVLDHVVDLLRPISHAVGVSVTAEAASHTAIADAGRLTDVLVNLATNAVKYNQFGGSVRLSATIDRSEVVIEVRDTGIGIAPEELGAIFEPFHRSNPKAGVEGTGLGLSIARSYAAAMRGSLTVRSTLGEGSSFTLRLPAGADAVEDAAPAPRNRIVYIEDSPINARLMDRLISKHRPDYTLVVAPDAANGLALVEELDPVLVLLDYNLPDMNGSDVLRALQQRGHDVPVVVVTADARAALADEVTALGARAVVTKPFAFETMLAVIDQQVCAVV